PCRQPRCTHRWDGPRPSRSARRRPATGGAFAGLVEQWLLASSADNPRGGERPPLFASRGDSQPFPLQFAHETTGDSLTRVVRTAALAVPFPFSLFPFTLSAWETSMARPRSSSAWRTTARSRGA